MSSSNRLMWAIGCTSITAMLFLTTDPREGQELLHYAGRAPLALITVWLWVTLMYEYYRFRNKRNRQGR